MTVLITNLPKADCPFLDRLPPPPQKKMPTLGPYEANTHVRERRERQREKMRRGRCQQFHNVAN